MTTIRVLHRDDLAAVRGLVGELHEQMRSCDPSLPPSSVILETYFGYLLKTAAETEGGVFVAEQDGVLVGHACLFGRMRSAEADEDGRMYAFLAELYVQPAWRGRGIGKALLARAERHARALGMESLELKVYAANRQAIDFYASCGWRTLVRHMGKSLKDSS
jgi:GNAT superfamily N-acetyltransferase